jgi:hypothetical protein
MWEAEYLPTYREVVEFCRNMQQGLSLEWYKLREEQHMYELHNRDYIDALAKILIPYKNILEVGAGDGRLSHFLRQRLPESKIVAIDNGSWKIEPAFSVETMEIDEALEKYKPDLVISCWMPYSADWTPLFRQCNSVRGYVLIGETDGGCCGCESLWFGQTEGEEPGYIKDGFVRHNLDELRKLQICRTDYYYDLDDDWRHSSTVLFLRE